MKEFSTFSVTLDTMRSCILGLFLLTFLHSTTGGPTDDTVFASATAVLNEKARLPCDVSSQLPNDRVVLILWYRGSAGTPLYSFDSRGSTDENGKHWWDEMLLDKRAYFQLLPGGTLSTNYGAYMEIYPVQDRDQAVYRCRVDYLLSPTKNTIVNFTVIIPPNKPEIYNSNGTIQLAGGRKEVNIIGPYNEGSELVLVCKVHGGRPPPEVVWLVDRKVWRTDTTQEIGGTTRASLVVPVLTRRHLNAILECRASNYNGSASSSSMVTLDMNFRPSNVSIISNSDSLSDGTEYEIVCQTWGSRPASTITWWKGGTMALKNAVMTHSPDNNVTTSILKYVASRSDNGKYLTCRAENTAIPQSAKEGAKKLNIYYKPVVTLRMGSNLDPENIKERDDVYFECHINANPVVTRVFWYHNGSPLEHRVSRGIIIQNQTLVLQKISRDAAGFYTCRAINSEGEGESQPVNLQVMYKPYCRRHSKTIYGTALHEPASVTCEVEASPGPVTFRWTFNNTSEHLPISASAVTSHGFTPVASYAPKSHLDYGNLLCWALNEIGSQSVPCAFTIIPAGPPDQPKNCSIANQTTDTIEVECTPGFDGGLPQTFYMEVYDTVTGALLANMSSPEPLFLLTALRPGLAFLMVTYAANAKGISPKAQLETFTLKVAEKRTGPPALFEFTPVLWIVIGVMTTILLIVAAIMLVMKFRKPSTSGGQDGRSNQDENKVDLENKPLNVGSVLRARVREMPGGASGNEVEDNDPDLIPHKADIMAYPPYETLESGPAVSSSQFSSAFDMMPTVRSLPLQRNPSSSGAEVTYVELAAPRDEQGPYPVVSAHARAYTDVTDHRRSVNLGNPSASAVAAAESKIYASLVHRRSATNLSNLPGAEAVFYGVAEGTVGSGRRSLGMHHVSNPNLYATLEARRSGTTTTTSTTNPSMYATLPHRREAFATATSSTTANLSTTSLNTSPTGFRDIRRTLRTPLVRRPSESAV